MDPNENNPKVPPGLDESERRRAPDQGSPRLPADQTFPMQRNAGEFGTHGGSAPGKEQRTVQKPDPSTGGDEG